MTFLQIANSQWDTTLIDPVVMGYAIVLLVLIGEWLVGLLAPNRLSFIKSPALSFDGEGYLLKITDQSTPTQFTVTTSNIKLCDKKQNMVVSTNNVLSVSGGYRKSKYWLIAAIIAFAVAIIISLVSGGNILIFQFSILFLLIHIISGKSAYITIQTKGGEYHGVFFKAKTVTKDNLYKAVDIINEQVQNQ